MTSSRETEQQRVLARAADMEALADTMQDEPLAWASLNAAAKDRIDLGVRVVATVKQRTERLETSPLYRQRQYEGLKAQQEAILKALWYLSPGFRERYFL